MSKEAIVVGGGLAGLSATMKLAEQGIHVKLVSVTAARRSHSVCAQGGINAAVNLKSEGDSPLIHAYETLKGGDFLADQPPVLEMCLAAPGILYLMEKLGCPFNRTKEGDLDVRRFGGSLYHRTAFCGASTGQQLLYTLDEQVRRYEVEGKVERWEHHELLRLCLDEEGRARGIVIMDIFSLALRALKADAIIVATGGLGALFKKSTNSTSCTGAANGRLFMQGMQYANGEFIQIHPTAIFGEDKMRLISESARGEGGRLWVYGDASKTLELAEGRVISCGQTGQPWYFLEEMYPAFGNLVPRDIAAREVLRVVELGLGVEGKMQVFLDVSHLSGQTQNKLTSVLDLYHKFVGEDPRRVPMRIFPAMHYSMGGAWVDWPASDDIDRALRFRQMTSIPGCFNVGESEFLYHGANRLGANSLLSCIFAGLIVGSEVRTYLDSSLKQASSSVFLGALQEEEAFKAKLFSRKGPERVHRLHDELADLMVRHVTVKRNNAALQQAFDQIKALRERYQHISLDDPGSVMNQTYMFAHQFAAMLELALVITKGALLRNESRGAHYKPEWKERNDKDWLKTTMATYAQDEPQISYRPVDCRYLAPEKREYVTKNKHEGAFVGVPLPQQAVI